MVTPALAADITALAKRGPLASDREKRLPDNASPDTSMIVFLVRNWNPKQVRDRNDLLKPGVQVIPPDPATSGWAGETFPPL